MRSNGKTSGKPNGRRQFTDDFKKSVVRRIISGEKTRVEIELQYRIVPSLLSRWIEQYGGEVRKMEEHRSAETQNSDAAVEAPPEPLPAPDQESDDNGKSDAAESDIELEKKALKFEILRLKAKIGDLLMEREAVMSQLMSDLTNMMKAQMAEADQKR